MTPTVEETKKMIADPNKQYEVLLWTESVLRPLADPAKYEKLCNPGGDPFVLTPEIFKSVQTALYPYAAGGTPGHDFGHHKRDLLDIIALVGNDPEVAKAYTSEIIACIFGGAYHDIGCAITDRYKDNVAWLGHAEVGAWLFFTLTENLLPEHIRILVAYAIAAHTHALNPVATNIGYIRQPWEDKLFYNLGRPIRVAVWFTRFADRLDTGTTLLGRHPIAQLDSYVYKGVDLSGKDSFPADDRMLKLLLKPIEVTEEKTPSTLQHLRNFANSANQTTVNPYNQHDARFPMMNRFMTDKAKNAHKLLSVIASSEKSILDTISQKTIASPLDSQFFWEFILKVSCTNDTEAVHTSFNAVWEKLSPEEQQKWIPGIKFAVKEYDRWMSYLVYKIKHSSLPMIQALAPTIMEIVQQ